MIVVVLKVKLPGNGQLLFYVPNKKFAVQVCDATMMKKE
jgi:hypothetical protein